MSSLAGTMLPESNSSSSTVATPTRSCSTGAHPEARTLLLPLVALRDVVVVVIASRNIFDVRALPTRAFAGNLHLCVLSRADLYPCRRNYADSDSFSREQGLALTLPHARLAGGSVKCTTRSHVRERRA